MSRIHDAFFQLVENPEACGTYWVSLIKTETFYGGPEEGGWWGEDHIPIATKEVATKREAKLLRQRIAKLAAELSREEQQDHSARCQRQLEWAEARGMDADDVFGEVDGPTLWSVRISRRPPREIRGSRSYE